MLDKESIEKQLAIILQSSTFANSSRSGKFLKYVVTQALAGNENALKESIVGVEVFGKSPGWDSRGVSVVRTAATRLRRSLKTYYETEGINDPVIILIEEGRYIPTFAPRQCGFEGTDVAALDIPGVRTADQRAEGENFLRNAIPEPNSVQIQASAINDWSQYTARAILVGALILLFFAFWASAFGLASLALVLALFAAGLEHFRGPDTLSSRAAVAVLALAAMAYIPSALTLSDVMNSAVNMDALPPAVFYPFVTGLKFIPLGVLVLGYWVALKFFDDHGFERHPGLKRLYSVLGVVFLFATVVSLIPNSGDYLIWRAGLPGRSIIVGGYAIIGAMNVGAWFAGRHFFRNDCIHSYRPLLFWCGIAYVPVIVASFIVDGEYNKINQHYLDIRRPTAYAALNANAIGDVGTPGRIGPRLRTLLADPQFRAALQTGRFFKQNFDEPFQVLHHAVMFGYRPQTSSGRKAHGLVIIRFPRELADALQFEPIEEQR